MFLVYLAVMLGHVVSKARKLPDPKKNLENCEYACNENV
jgi:hypothetical protein